GTKSSTSYTCSSSPGMPERSTTSLPRPSGSAVPANRALRKNDSHTGHFSTALSGANADSGSLSTSRLALNHRPVGAAWDTIAMFDASMRDEADLQLPRAFQPPI